MCEYFIEMEDRLKNHPFADSIKNFILGFEDEELKNLERVSNFIERVKSMGAKIAIDDFGSGYSNFSYIIKIKPDYVKIDGSIIKDIDINKDSHSIASAIGVTVDYVNGKVLDQIRDALAKEGDSNHAQD